MRRSAFARLSLVKRSSGPFTPVGRFSTHTTNASFDPAPLAASLAKAWNSKSSNDLVGAPTIKFSVPDAYAIQSAASAIVEKQHGIKRIGWKIGATSRAVQMKFDTKEPFAGPVFASRYHHNATSAQTAFQYKWDDFAETIRGVECEFAFRFRQYKPAPKSITGKEEMARALESITAILPSIEIASTRWRAGFPGTAPLAIADFGTTAHIITGTPIDRFAKTTEGTFQMVMKSFENTMFPANMTLFVNGVKTMVGTSHNVMGHPLNAISWLNHWLYQRDPESLATLPENEMSDVEHFVSTGSCTGVTDVKRGDVVYADFGSLLGQIHLKF